MLLLLMASQVHAQSSNPNPNQFCYLVAGTATYTCSDLLQDTETAMRSAPAFGAAGGVVRAFRLAAFVARRHTGQPYSGVHLHH